ncbi:MAG TPA: hypothetical protein VN613_02275 [Gemmatimonadaceae bacterium]|nr:hypothetical protein [Gemmatimonadaceae bacterium]
MEIAARVDTGTAALPAVEYRWDADTDILTAIVGGAAKGEGMSGSVEVEGSDGSWLIFDVSGGRIAGVEVAVWPDVRKVATLVPPAGATPAVVTIPSRPSQPGVASLEVDTHLVADADASERTIHFRFGSARPMRAVRVAEDMIFDVDDADRITGVWMLNVPPFPSDQ